MLAIALGGFTGLMMGAGMGMLFERRMFGWRGFVYEYGVDLMVLGVRICNMSC